MMKKLIALMLALLTLVSFAACSKEGADDKENLDSFKEEEVVFTSVTNDYGTFHFEALDSDTVAITKYEGSTNLHEVVVPSTVQTGEDAETTTKTVAEVPMISAISVVFALCVLLLTTASWVEPLVVLAGIGVAVVVNNSSANAYLGGNIGMEDALAGKVVV